MTKTGSVVFFEIYSPLQVLVLAPRIRKSTAIVFSRRTPFVTPSARAKRVTLRLVRILNPVAPVRELAVADLLDYLVLNGESPDRLAALAPMITSSYTYRALRRVIADDALVRYFQAAESMAAANWRLFPRAAGRIAGSGEVIAVPDWDTAVMADQWPAGVAVGGRRINRVRRWLARWSATAQSIALPLGFLIRSARNGWRSGPPSGPYAAAMPVIWGIPDGDGPSAEVRRPHADDYLYGSALYPGDILHLFGDWSADSEEERRSKRAMTAKGYAFADKRCFTLDIKTTTAAVQALVGMLCLVTPRRRKPVDDLVLRNAPKAIYHYLRKVLEFANVRYSVEIVRNDYNPGHVVAAIVSRLYGTRTVAVQHNALPYEGPQIAFVEADHLATYGEFYRRGYAPHWDRLSVHHTGRESLDWTVAVKRDARRLAALREKWDAFRPKRRPMALVVFPGDREICIEQQWHELYGGLRQIAATQQEIDIVLRFRNQKSLRVPHVRQFADLAALDDRFIVVWSEFMTDELTALSDVVISHDGSFTVNEAIALGKPTFTFEFVMAGRHYFKRYGRDFVLTTAADAVRVLQSIGQGFAEFECDWQGLARDLNSHIDGANRERLRALVESAAGVKPKPAAVAVSS